MDPASVALALTGLLIMCWVILDYSSVKIIINSIISVFYHYLVYRPSSKSSDLSDLKEEYKTYLELREFYIKRNSLGSETEK